MRFRSDTGQTFLIDIADLARPSAEQPVQVRENLVALRQVADWAERFLCRPHAQLGRSGDVCPYTRAALRHNLFWLSVCRGAHLTPAEVYTQLIEYRDWLLELAPLQGKEARFKTILVLFPDVDERDAPEVIDVVQRALKPEFVAQGLMIGQFHPTCPEPGLWSPDFRPLQAPVPLLAMRQMVLTDLPFLCRDERFLSAYVRHFGAEIPPATHQAIAEARVRLNMKPNSDY